MFHGGGHRMGGHHEAAVAADIDTRGLRSGEFGAQYAADSEAHGRKPSWRYMGLGLRVPSIARPSLVVSYVGYKNAVFRSDSSHIQ